MPRDALIIQTSTDAKVASPAATAQKGTWHSVGRVLHFAKAEWQLIAMTLLAIYATTACELTYLYFAKPFIEAFQKIRESSSASVTMEYEDLTRIAKFALLLAPVMAICTFGQHYYQGRTVWRLTVKLRNKVCNAILPQSLSFFEDRRSGDLMSRITNDAARAKQCFTLMYGDIPEQTVRLLGSVGFALVSDWRLFTLSLVFVPALVFPISYLSSKIRRYGKAGLERLGDLTDLMAQMFSGIRIIKAFKMEDAEADEFERVNEKVFSKMMKSITARSMSQGTIELIVRGFLGVGALVVAWFTVHRSASFDLKSQILCVGAMYYAFQSTKKLTKAYNELQEVAPAADRIFELIEHVPSVQDAPDAVTLNGVKKTIAFNEVSFGYAGEKVLKDVSFAIKRGERVAIVGKSGAGKSTLIALLCRFYDVSSGSIEIDGLDIKKITHSSLLDQFAMVTQQTFLFNRTIAENIRYGRRDATMEEVEKAARAANIHDFIVSQPEGYKTMCGEYGAKLSGGQRQRIAIARALLKNADILILDEAMVGLDAESEKAVREALDVLMQGRTTFMITHDLQTIQSADRILMMRDGRLVEHGTHKELMEKQGDYCRLFNIQFGLTSAQPQQSMDAY